MIYLVWIFGILGLIANFLIYQQKNRKKILAFKLTSDVMWMLHYLFLMAFTGAAGCFIGVIRETVFLRGNKSKKAEIAWLCCFLVLSFLASIFTWKNIFSLMPALASALSVFSFWKSEPWLTKKLAYPISVLYLLYNISCLSYIGIVNEIFILTSTTIGIIQMKKTA